MWIRDVRNRYNSIMTQRAMVAQRAISHRPDLAGRVHIYRGGADEIQAVALNDYTDYADVHAQHVWFRKGVKVISDNLSPLPVRVVDADGEPKDNHPVSQLLTHCNDQHGPAQLWASWVAHMVIGGESFVEILSSVGGKPLQLWARRPDQIAIVPDASRPTYPNPLGYKWIDSEDDGMEWDAADMMHWKFDNPVNVWRGLSLIGAVRAGLTIDIFAQAWSKKFLQSGGNPDWALIAPQGVTVTEREFYERIIEQKWLGSENWHKPIVLEDGITDIKPLSFPPKDIQWLEQRKNAREEIGGILGVPDVLLGFGPESYDTEQKRTGALRTLWTLTLVPLVDLRDDQMTSFFTRRRPMLGPGERIQTDLSSVGVLQEDIAPKVDTAVKLWSMGVPFNLIEERLGLDIGEIESGDVGYMQMGLIEAGTERPMFAPPSFAPAGETDDEERALLPLIVKDDAPTTKAPPYDSVEHRAYMKRRDAIVLPYEEQMMRTLLKFFQAQQNQIGRRFRDAQPKQDAAAFPPLESLFDSEEELERYKELIRPLVEAMFNVSGTDALTLVLGQDGPQFNMRRVDVRQAIEYILELDAQRVNETTFREVTEVFQEASDEGLSVPNTMDRISSYFTDRKQPYQLERIARTTMISANNAASMAAYDQSGVVKSTEWLTSIDGRQRDDHETAHGQERPLGRAFEVGGELVRFPGDPWASAAQRINCRCSTIPITYSNEELAGI